MDTEKLMKIYIKIRKLKAQIQELEKKATQIYEKDKEEQTK